MRDTLPNITNWEHSPRLWRPEFLLKFHYVDMTDGIISHAAEPQPQARASPGDWAALAWLKAPTCDAAGSFLSHLLRINHHMASQGPHRERTTKTLLACREFQRSGGSLPGTGDTGGGGLHTRCCTSIKITRRLTSAGRGRRLFPVSDHSYRGSKGANTDAVGPRNGAGGQVAQA